jgi:hypothetical protein
VQQRRLRPVLRHRDLCLPVPETCPDVWQPVCDSNKVVWANDCLRLKAGAIRLEFAEAAGGCRSGSPLCDKANPTPCPAGLVCTVTSCDTTEGFCVTPPAECPDIDEPVCSCDGVWYPNECERIRVGMPALRPDDCATDHCAPECRTDACGTSYWMYPCTDEYLCNADCEGCTASGDCTRWEASCPGVSHRNGCAYSGVDFSGVIAQGDC